jgi:hypothetical protein
VKDFHSNVCESFITVSDDFQQFSAHKVVLSSCSPVWKNLLRSNKHSHPMLYIRGVKNMELNNILDFAYSGEITIQQEHLDLFLAIAEDLKLKGLSNAGVEDKPNIQDIHHYGISDLNSANIASKTIERDLIPLEEVTQICDESIIEDFNETKYYPNEHINTTDFEAVNKVTVEKAKKVIVDIPTNAKVKKVDVHDETPDKKDIEVADQKPLENVSEASPQSLGSTRWNCDIHKLGFRTRDDLRIHRSNASCFKKRNPSLVL